VHSKAKIARSSFASVLHTDQLIGRSPTDLGNAFQLFRLNNDPDWSSVDRVVFQSLAVTGGGGVALIDNIVVNAVPEPTSLILLGTGVAGLWARRRARARG
jgi:hypothetical protein